MKRIKKVAAAVLVFVMIFCIDSTSFAEAAANPVSLTSTVLKDSIFTVNINVKAGTDMQAFTYILKYDATKVAVAGGRVTAYGFYTDLLSSYNSDNKGLTVYNNIINGTDSHLIFAGAQATADLAQIKANSKAAYIKFRLVDDVTDEEAFKEILNGIYLQVDYLEGSTGNLVTMYPEAFANPVAAQLVEDETGGEDIMLGDINMDQSITLEDAQTVLKAALSIKVLTIKEKLAADVNGDGEVTLADAQAVLKAALGISPL